MPVIFTHGTEKIKARKGLLRPLLLNGRCDENVSCNLFKVLRYEAGRPIIANSCLIVRDCPLSSRCSGALRTTFSIFLYYMYCISIS